MDKTEINRISVFGLGKLGSPLSAVFANAGYQVVGVDTNQLIVDDFSAGVAPVNETGLQALMTKAGKNLSATTSFSKAIIETNASFLIVPTPSIENGQFSNDYILQAIRKIAAEVAKKDSYHLVVICSTVMPGSMEKLIRPLLEKESGKSASGNQLGLCYNPEFIALGSVIKDMQNPDLVLIGESDKKAGDLLEGIHKKICKNTPETHRMNFVNAELTKISINTFITTKISYANMLSEICDELPLANASIVTEAVGADSRIGRKYLKSATGYGGPCFPRDTVAFSAMGKELKVNCNLATATGQINARQVARIMKLVKKIALPEESISILGLSYKAETSEVTESQGISLTNLLAQAEYRTTVYDPQANENARSNLESTVKIAPTLENAIEKADIIVIMTPWLEFSKIPEKTKKNCRFIDPWCLLNGPFDIPEECHFVPGNLMK